MKSFKTFYEEVMTEKKAKQYKKPSWKEIKKRKKSYKKPKKVSKPKKAFDDNLFKKGVKNAKKFFSKFISRFTFSESFDTDKVKALKQHLVDEEGVGIYELGDIDNSYGNEYETEYGDYLVLTDDEADQALKEYIEQSVWAFNTSFLSYFIDAESIIDYLGLEREYYDEDEDEYIEMGDDDEVLYMQTGGDVDDWIKSQQERCEDGNDDLMAVIDDFDSFVRDAEMTDGRGHFLNNYDSTEYEAGDYYIYRTN